MALIARSSLLHVRSTVKAHQGHKGIDHANRKHRARKLRLLRTGQGRGRAYGWVTVSLIQRRLRLSYGFALSLVHGLERRGVVGPIDATGRRLAISPAGDAADAVAALQPGATSAPTARANLSITPQNPLHYRSQDEGSSEHSVTLTPSTIRADDFHDEMGAEPRAPVDTVLTRYFAGESQHGTFEVLVSCRRTGPGACFEMEDVAVVVKQQGVEILQIRAFTVTESEAEEPSDPTIEPAKSNRAGVSSSASPAQR